MSSETASKELKFDYWMPFDIGRFLQDTMDLTTEEIGAYVLLLLRYWTRGPLPNDPARLANISKINAHAWSTTYATLSMFFTVGEDGLLHQKGADRRRDEWALKRKKAHDKAVKAARARWDKQKAKPGMLGASPKQSMSNALHQSLSTNPKGDSLRSSPLPPAGSPEASPAHGSKQRAKTTGTGQESPAGTPDGPTPHKSPTASATGKSRGLVQPSVNGKHPQKPTSALDQRFTPFRGEVFAWWRAQNPKAGECPWISSDKRALRQFLANAPSIDLAGFKALLRNRAGSEVLATSPPRKWLADLLEYSEGELDRYKKPLRNQRIL